MRHPLYKQVGGVLVVRSTNICGVAYIFQVAISALFAISAISSDRLWNKSISFIDIFIYLLLFCMSYFLIIQTLRRFKYFYRPLFIVSRSRLYIRGAGLRWGYRSGEVKCRQILAAPLWGQKFIPTDRAPKGARVVTVFPSDVWLLSTSEYYSNMIKLGWFIKENK